MLPEDSLFKGLSEVLDGGPKYEFPFFNPEFDLASTFIFKVDFFDKFPDYYDWG